MKRVAEPKSLRVGKFNYFTFMKNSFIYSSIMILASTIAYAGNPPEKQSSSKPNAATVGAAGSIQGYWGMCGNEVACLDHPTSKCVEIVIKPKASYQSLPCTRLIQDVYTNSDLIDKIELHLYENSGTVTVNEISAFTISNVCQGKSLDYTAGNWKGVYNGQIQINTCIIE